MVRWREPTPIPPAAAALVVQRCVPPLPGAIVFSALDAPVAREVEPAFAAAGSLVVTNASAFRMDPQVPLLICEVNADHLGLLPAQRRVREWTGAIVANPNCSAAALILALAPLHRAFGIEKLFVATDSGGLGRGLSRVASLDILGNVTQFIASDEEDRAGDRKILGTLAGTG